MYILIFLSFVIFVISAIIFQLKLRSSRGFLLTIDTYKGISWRAIYTDPLVQVKIIKAIFAGRSIKERELKKLLFAQIISFFIFFILFIYLLIA